jgi:2-oxoisovalerate dehydrogenase E1 component beta subunit
MATVDMLVAIRSTLAGEMRRDDRVVLLGESIAALGGVFQATEGLLAEFGAQRVIDMPLGEGGIVGAAAGMALYGLKPVAEIQHADFAFSGFEQIVSEVAKYRYRSGGQYPCPVVLRMPYGGGIGGGIYHSQSPEAHFAHTPGLLVVAPSSPRDAAGLLRTAIRGQDPVIFLEPKRLYRSVGGEVPDDDFTIPIGEAARLREGGDVTVIAYGAMLHEAVEAAERAAADGIGVDLLDLRTLVPFDIGAVLESVARTGRAVLVQEAPRLCGFTAELAAVLAEKAVFHLQAPVLRVGGYDTPVPYALERDYLPDAGRVLAAIQRVCNF